MCVYIYIYIYIHNTYTVVIIIIIIIIIILIIRITIIIIIIIIGNDVIIIIIIIIIIIVIIVYTYDVMSVQSGLKFTCPFLAPLGRGSQPAVPCVPAPPFLNSISLYIIVCFMFGYIFIFSCYISNFCTPAPTGPEGARAAPRGLLAPRGPPGPG